MRTLGHLLVVVFIFLGLKAHAQTETFSAGSGGSYDASVCNDPRIAALAAQLHATPYHDDPKTGQATPLRTALDILAQKYDNGQINEASACLHAPGVVYMVPTNLVPEVTKLVGQIQAAKSQNPETFNGADQPESQNPPPSGGTPGPTGRGPQGGPGYTINPLDPCHPNYNMSTPAGRAAAQQSAAEVKQVCDEYRCKHNPQLPFCATIITQSPPQPGEKSLKLEKEPPPTMAVPTFPTGTVPSLSAVWKVMANCLSTRTNVPIAAVFLPQIEFLRKASYSLPASMRDTPFDQLPFRTQVFQRETAMALQAQAYHDSRFGDSNEKVIAPIDAKDYMIGWFDQCLRTSGMLPNSSERSDYAYADYVGIPRSKLIMGTDRRVEMFDMGFNNGADGLAPQPLQPDVSVY